MIFNEIAERSSADEIDRAIDDFLDIGGFIDAWLKQQTAFDLASLEAAIGRTLSEAERTEFMAVQHQAMRWTFLGSAMSNRGFLDALGSVSKSARARIEQVVPVFC